MLTEEKVRELLAQAEVAYKKAKKEHAKCVRQMEACEDWETELNLDEADTTVDELTGIVDALKVVLGESDPKVLVKD